MIFKKIGGHSPDSAFVYSPSEKVLCIGDNLQECYAQLPGNPDETSIIFDELKSLDIKIIVPGHGRFVGPAYFDKVVNYFKNVITFLKRAIADKITLRNILQHPELPEYFGRTQDNWTEGLKPDSKWIENTIRSWYRYIKRESKT